VIRSATTPGRRAIAICSLATNFAGKDKETRGKQEKPENARVVFYGRLAEIVREYTRKGSRVLLSRSLRTRKVAGQGRAGSIHDEIIGSLLTVIDKKGGGRCYAQSEDESGASERECRRRTSRRQRSKSDRGSKRVPRTERPPDGASGRAYLIAILAPEQAAGFDPSRRGA